MIRKMTFYWILVTLTLVDSWLLSKPNILGKVGLIIYKYHYLRSFPRTLLTVWIVVSLSILVVFLIQFLVSQKRLSTRIAQFILGTCLVLSLLMLAKVYIDFTAWTYSHSGMKFRYGAYLLPVMMILIFANGMIQIQRTSKDLKRQVLAPDVSPESEESRQFNQDTLQP